MQNNINTDPEGYIKHMIKGALMGGLLTIVQAEEIIKMAVQIIHGNHDLDSFRTIKIEDVMDIFKVNERSEALKIWENHNRQPLKFGKNKQSAVRFYIKDVKYIQRTMEKNYKDLKAS